MSVGASMRGVPVEYHGSEVNNTTATTTTTTTTATTTTTTTTTTNDNTDNNQITNDHTSYHHFLNTIQFNIIYHGSEVDSWRLIVV